MKGDVRRYLTAKETVDERAFAPGVRDRVREDLAHRSDSADRSNSAARSGSVRLLDAGTGTGPFLRRLLDWPDLPDLTCVAVDTDGAVLELARELTAAAARERGYSVAVGGTGGTHGTGDTDATGGASGTGTASGTGGTGDADAFDGPGETVGTLSLRGDSAVDVRFVRGDALAVVDVGEWEVVVAQAFVDLLAPAEADRLLDGLAPGGRFYFPITFDGGTAFAPPHDADDAVVSAYHETMGGVDGAGSGDVDGTRSGGVDGTQSGDVDGMRSAAVDRLGARAGRRLERRLDVRGVDYVAADADWRVRPVDGGYPADEAYFLRVVVDTVADAVRGRVSEATRTEWLAARREQLDDGRLTYLARNRDVTGRVG